MLTLSQVKTDLGLQQQATDMDATLLSFIRQAATLARHRTGRYLHCATDAYTLASDVVTVSAPAHGLIAGETVTLRNTGLNVDGERVVSSVPTPHSFTFAFTDALSGTAGTGSVHPRRQFEVAGSNSSLLWAPQAALPWLALDVLETWDGTDWAEVATEDYTARADVEGKAAAIELVNSEIFGRLTTTYAGQFGRTVYNRDASVRLTVDLGAETLPGDVELALLSIVAELAERQGGGRDLANVSMGGASRSAFTGTEKFEQRYSPDNVWLNWKAMQ